MQSVEDESCSKARQLLHFQPQPKSLKLFYCFHQLMCDGDAFTAVFDAKDVLVAIKSLFLFNS
jgi:hypothetical protein